MRAIASKKVDTAVEIHLQQAVIRHLWTSMDDFWTSMDVNGQKWTKKDKNGQKWTKMDKNRRLWTSLDKNGQNWTKIDAVHGRPWTSMVD